MKKITTLVFMMLISFCFVISGCAETPLTMPENYLNPYSNGGFVLGAGNYMYFANAYKDSSSLTDRSENEGEGVSQYSLKRVQINAENKWFNIVKDEDKKISYDNVINKISGYQVSNMYAVNEYLYFTSPNVHKNKENEYEFNLSTLFRIKLDGTGLKEIYTTKSDGAKFYLTGNENAEILIFDDEKIIKIDVENNSTAIDVLVENVAAVEFPKEQEQVIDWLYYTSNRDEDDQFTGNIVNKANIETGEVIENLIKIAGVTVNIIAQDHGKVFYIKSNGSQKDLYSNDFTSSASEIAHGVVVDDISDGSDLMYVKCENSEYDCFVYVYNDNLYLQLITSTLATQSKIITSETATLQFINGSYVYYSTDTGIYRFSVIERVQQQITDKANINSGIMDFDGRYVYFFAKGEEQESETEYLYRADAYASGEFRVECIAELLEEDIPDNSDKNEEE